MNVITSNAVTQKLSAWPVSVRALTAFALGALMVSAMPPWCLWPALFIGLSGFYIFLSTVTKPKAAFFYGWLFGFAYFVISLSWIANALLVEGNDFAWVWPLAVAGLPALLALFPALACMLIVKFGTLTRFSGYLSFVVMLMTFEWLRGHIFTGFPWNLYGYTWSNTLEIAQIASVGGIYWLTLATCMWATLLGFLFIWPQKKWIKAAFILFLILDMGGSYAYGHYRMKKNYTDMQTGVAVRLVQPNIPQEDKWNPEKAQENLQKLLKLSASEHLNGFVNTIIVWPETALNEYILKDGTSAAAMKAVLSGYDKPVALLSGVLRSETDEDGNRKYFNSLVAFDRSLNRIATYNKSHLVPFGEYIPFKELIPLKPFVQYAGFEQGNGIVTADLKDFGIPLTYTPLICYEIIFSGKTAGTPRPEFIVNITNDAWYGDSAGPRQHFAMAQFRAIEEGVPVIRSANTGISGIIDPLGRVTYRENLNKQAGNNVALPKKVVSTTYFSKLKDSLFFITLGFLLLIIIYFQIYNRKNS